MKNIAGNSLMLGKSIYRLLSEKIFSVVWNEFKSNVDIRDVREKKLFSREVFDEMKKTRFDVHRIIER